MRDTHGMRTEKADAAELPVQVTRARPGYSPRAPRARSRRTSRVSASRQSRPPGPVISMHPGIIVLAGKTADRGGLPQTGGRSGGRRRPQAPATGSVSTLKLSDLLFASEILAVDFLTSTFEIMLHSSEERVDELLLLRCSCACDV